MYSLFLVLALAAVCHAIVEAAAKKERRVMTWLCLEFCEESQETIQNNLKQLEAHPGIFSAVSFEKYTLGANSTLVDNHLTVVSPAIIAMGYEAWPLLSSFPHPPEFIDWMRQVFANPQPFFDQCISEARAHGYIGYNLDWEPTDDVTADDGIAYAAFIDAFSNSLHGAGLLLSVDIATWSPIWNYTAIAATSVDFGVSMGTYTSSDSSFSKQLSSLVTNFPPPRAGVGLMTVNATDNSPLSLEEITWRFDQMRAAQVTEVDIWCSPVPDDWWPVLRDFVFRP